MLNKMIISLSLLLSCFCIMAQSHIPLDGKWTIALDPHKKGIKEGWQNREFKDPILLPGTTDMAGYGKAAPEVTMDNQYTFGWRRPAVYEGHAWYSREVDIPKDWKGRHIELYLEQTRSETSVWVDGVKVPGTEMSLLTAHRHNLSAFLTPGKHRITLLLDNGDKHGIGGSYVRSPMGQGNWQGITGKIELRATDPIWIKHTVFTPISTEKAKIEAGVGLLDNKGDDITINVEILDGHTVLKKAYSKGCSTEIDITGLALWDEFNPACYTLRTTIRSGKHSDCREEQIGIRFVGTNERNQFTVNGRPIFLRGTVSYNIFPITGYPATDLESWMRTFSIYKEWGMNHVRFHSLTPPEAALIAADRLGIYLQCEAPKAGRCGRNPEDDEFHIAEGKRILKDYGNHPSFIMMSMGNELAGNVSDIQRIFDEVTADDHRRLYTTTTGSAKLELKDDYKIYGGIVRGFKGPFTDWDYREKAREIGRTMLSHEVGQWHTYPDMRQIEKYTGVMQCDNLKAIRDDLRSKGLEDRALDFTQTTGKVAALLYKDEMEAIFRTPDYGGFQILTLNDFPAQGTASSGMIDIFDDPKGYLEAERFREYCAPVVPLLRIGKRTFFNDEVIKAGIDLSCYDKEDMKEVVIEWELAEKGRALLEGNLHCGTVKTGNVYNVGNIEIPLGTIKKASALEIILSVKDTEYRNRWNIWVYPDNEIADIPSDIFVTSSWNEAEQKLSEGRKVLLFASADEMGKWRPGQFKTIFWSPVWLKRGVETMSVTADVSHPALAGFPTERHTDWQWFNPLENSITMCIDDLPHSFTPIVGMIDSFRKNQRLANMLEARIGDGRILITSIDIMRNLKGDPARTALRNSILRYMGSEDFNPVQSVSPEQMRQIFTRHIIRCEEPDLKNAPLHISADGKVNTGRNNYGLSVKSKVQKSGDLTAWADKRDLNFTVNIPEQTTGTLWLRMLNSRSSRWGMLKTPQEIAEVDWVEETFENYGNKQPVAGIIINDHYVGTINEFGSKGQWFAIPIDSSQSQDGKIKVSISTFNYPNILLESAFTHDFLQ